MVKIEIAEKLTVLPELCHCCYYNYYYFYYFSHRVVEHDRGKRIYLNFRTKAVK